jgi:hypothetical protein
MQEFHPALANDSDPAQLQKINEDLERLENLLFTQDRPLSSISDVQVPHLRGATDKQLAAAFAVHRENAGCHAMYTPSREFNAANLDHADKVAPASESKVVDVDHADKVTLTTDSNAADVDHADKVNPTSDSNGADVSPAAKALQQDPEFLRSLFKLYQEGTSRDQYAWSGHQLNRTPDFFRETIRVQGRTEQQFKLLPHQLDGAISRYTSTTKEFPAVSSPMALT